MRTRRRPKSRIPEVNLVPMMDVLMTVLIFFVIISMSLTGVQISGVTLPKSVSSPDEETVDNTDEARPLTIGLTMDGTLIIEGESTDLRSLNRQVQAYFAENPNGSLMLKADRNLPYDDIANLLDELRKVGGQRVSLAVE